MQAGTAVIISVSFCFTAPDFHTLMPRQYFLPASKDLEGGKVARCSRSSCASNSRSSRFWTPRCVPSLHRLALIQLTALFQNISFSIPNSSASSVVLHSSTKQGFARVASLILTCGIPGNPHIHLRPEMVLGYDVPSAPSSEGKGYLWLLLSAARTGIDF